MKRNIPTILLIILAAIAGYFAANSSDSSKDEHKASTRPIVYVENHLNSNWPVLSAVWFVNQYTGSLSTFHTCVSGIRCIRLYQNSYIPANGLTYVGNPTYILVNGHAATTVWLFRRTLLAHELGHAHNLGHNPYCTSVMYPYLACYGHMAPQTFTATEQAILRAN